jgi:DNA modification methylase
VKTPANTQTISQVGELAEDRGHHQPRGLMDKIVWKPIADLRPFPGNPRRHPEHQIASLMKSIRRIWTNPILIDERCTILAGHGRFEAAKRLGMKEVPTITIGGLKEEEKRAILIADNRIPERAVWDLDLLRLHFQNLIEIDFEVELSGFTTGEIDLVLDGKPPNSDPADKISGFPRGGPAVSQLSDCWELARHRIICGSALCGDHYDRLLGDELAELIVAAPPDKAQVHGYGKEQGQIRRRKISETEYLRFLEEFIRLVVRHSQDGSIHFIFSDWKDLPELLSAARPIYSEWKNLLVWSKGNAGRGTFYHPAHELIAAFKSGSAAHIQNFGAGEKGRYRTNLLEYPEAGGHGRSRRHDRQNHPTAKPVALIADLIRDCSRRNGLILDPFGGAGTTILAAERTGRRARIIELNPLLVDMAVRRWQQMTGIKARHVESGLSFAQREAQQIEARLPSASEIKPRPT